MRRLRSVVAVVVAATTGCSAIWVERVPKPPPPDGHVRCTRSRSAPVFDSVVTAAATAALIGSGVGMTKDRCGPTQDCMGPDPVIFLSLVGVVTAAVLTTAFGASAAYGYVHTARCRALGPRGELRWAGAPRHPWLPPPVAGPGGP